MSETSGTGASAPRIHRNDYSELEVPALGAWHPSLTVSVVIPVTHDLDRLDGVLAMLADQTYPGHLMDVVIVAADGETLKAPDHAPVRTRVVHHDENGPDGADAVHTGVRHAHGGVILRLDPRLSIDAEYVEAHMRWHHLADYLVVVGSVNPAEDAAKPTWTSPLVEETRNLRDAGDRAYSAAIGPALSWSLDFYGDQGGFDRGRSLIGDTEFSHRLAQAGAVFVADPEARGWQAAAETTSADVERERRIEPFLRNRLPMRRDWRDGTRRQWLIPFIEVIVEVNGGSYENVAATIVGALAGKVDDLIVTIVAPWHQLDGHSPDPDDPYTDLRLLREAFRSDSRVRFEEVTPPVPEGCPFRVTCPPGAVLTPDSLPRLVERIETDGLGILYLAFQRGTELLIARLERTAAVARAHRLRQAAEDPEDVVSELHGVYWIDGSEWALTVPGRAAKPGVPAAQAELNRWKKEAARLKAEVAQWKTEAQIPFRQRLVRGARRRAGKVRIIRKLAGKDV
ncbi:MAG: glycosyltransferase [Hamadaea sp.]|nr:glycosyltransferase [Hamadaea sp.]NUR50235.1 glycosyltransferase [Hamadaea sp.]NUR95555.1 glycosyltransferase [Kribbellaceae bacterium]